MSEADRQLIVACVGLVSAGLVAWSVHNGWGWILLVTFLLCQD